MTNRTRSCVILCGFLCVIFVGYGCDWFTNKGDERKADKGTSDTVPATGSEVGEVVFAIKDGKSMMLLDIQPEAAKLVKLTATAREHYLMKRAFDNLDNKAMMKPPHSKKDRCVVRVVMLTSIDQYNRPVWGSAVEVANLEIDLAKVRQAGKAIADLKDGEIASFFVSKSVNHENIKEVQVSRIKIQ